MPSSTNTTYSFPSNEVTRLLDDMRTLAKQPRLHSITVSPPVYTRITEVCESPVEPDPIGFALGLTVYTDPGIKGDYMIVCKTAQSAATYWSLRQKGHSPTRACSLMLGASIHYLDDSVEPALHPDELQHGEADAGRAGVGSPGKLSADAPRVIVHDLDDPAVRDD